MVRESTPGTTPVLDVNQVERHVYGHERWTKKPVGWTGVGWQGRVGLLECDIATLLESYSTISHGGLSNDTSNCMRMFAVVTGGVRDFHTTFNRAALSVFRYFSSTTTKRSA
jgi:hypothetical protein